MGRQNLHKKRVNIKKQLKVVKRVPNRIKDESKGEHLS